MHSQNKSVITRLSPAKINLFLHITGKRADGYHNLQTVFRLIDWGDYLHFLPTKKLDIDKSLNLWDEEDSGILQTNKLCKQLITLTGADDISANIEDNLIFKAARALLVAATAMQKLPEHLQKVDITLDKRLPMGAGLGGGSSNAATTLLVLNEIWRLNLSRDELIKVATTVGADVPIFIFGQDAIATGIGEELTSINLPDQHYLILTPDTHVNTAKIFAHPKLQRNIASLSIEMIKSNTDDYTQYLNIPYQNVFTPVVESLAPAVSKALSYLQYLESQALGIARMTGSGSAVFLPLDASVFNDKTLLAKFIANAPCPAHVVKSL